MMKLPETIDGCTLVIRQCDKTVTCHRKQFWTFICSHRLFMRTIKHSQFGPDSIGKLYVPVQHAINTKSNGTAMKGKHDVHFFQSCL